MHIEREIKLGLTRAAEPALTRLAPGRRSVTSVYYDTARHELRRAGIALRLRRDGTRWLQTLKAESAPHAGLAARAEWELPVRRKALEPEAFPLEEIRSATGVDLVRLAKRLRPVFETRFTRQSGLVQLDGDASIEVAIDRGGILAGTRREPIREVELELISGDPGALLRFAESLALPLAYESKAERGYRLAAGRPRAPRKWSMPRLNAQTDAREAFTALFSAALMQVGTNAAGMLSSRDPEYLHQLRVGLRRLRSALRAFAPILHAHKQLRRAASRFSPRLGAARDWDVFVQHVPGVRGVSGPRDAARSRALASVASARFQGFLFRSLRWLQSAPWDEAGVTLAGFASARLERLHAKTLNGFDLSSAKRRHRLRIRVKRLRYACEFFAPCFPESDAYVAQLARLQDILGELNDIAVARRILGQLDAAVPPRLTAREQNLIAAASVAWKHFASSPRYWRRPG